MSAEDLEYYEEALYAATDVGHTKMVKLMKGVTPPENLGQRPRCKKTRIYKQKNETNTLLYDCMYKTAEHCSEILCLKNCKVVTSIYFNPGK